MKYAIIGAGPIGAGLGGLLAMSGEDVWLIDPAQSHINAIRKDGLQLTIEDHLHPVQTATVPVNAVTAPDTVGIADIVILSTKGCFTRSAIQNIKAVSDEHTIIVTSQNGLGNLDILKEFFPAKQLAYTVVEYGGSRIGDGKVRIVFTVGRCNLPITSENPDLEICIQDISKALSKQGFTMTFFPREQLDLRQWAKLTTNCALNGTCALCRCTMDGLLACQDGIDLARAIVLENCTVANALGVPLKPTDVDSIPVEVQSPVTEGYRHFPSMVSDVEGMRRTEWPFLNGAVMRLGRKMGIPTPYNDVVGRLLSISEQNYDCRKLLP